MMRQVLAKMLRETAAEILAWAAVNDGPFAEEIFRTNGQIALALSNLAERIEALEAVVRTPGGDA